MPVPPPRRRFAAFFLSETFYNLLKRLVNNIHPAETGCGQFFRYVKWQSPSVRQFQSFPHFQQGFQHIM